MRTERKFLKKTSKSDWVIIEAYDSKVSDNEIGVLYSDKSLKVRKSLIKSGFKFTGYLDRRPICCGFCSNRDDSPFGAINDAFGATTIRYET